MDMLEPGRWRLFAEMTPEEVTVIVEACETRLLLAGEDLFHEGEAADSMWMIRSGRVDIYTKIRGDIERLLASFDSGHVVGEMGFIDHTPRSAGARTSEASEFLVLSQTAFQRVRKEHPGVAAGLFRNLASILATRLRTTNELYRDSVLFAIEATGAGRLNLLALSEELRPVTIHLGDGSALSGRILQFDQSPSGYTLIVHDSSGRHVIIPYHAVCRVELA